jgi:hypothetical protein
MSVFKNGVEIYPSHNISQTISTKTDSYVITTADFGKSLRMNSASAKIFTLPSVASADDGARITIMKVGAGRVTIQAADTDIIQDSSAAGTMYCDAAAETYANVTLEYIDAITKWAIVSGTGTWITT